MSDISHSINEQKLCFYLFLEEESTEAPSEGFRERQQSLIVYGPDVYVQTDAEDLLLDCYSIDSA